MGRITIFTSNDLNSVAVLKALSERQLPFTEISLTDYPHKIDDLRALTGSLAVPRVFFNTRNVGSGVDPLLKELRSKWDSSRKYKSPLHKYKAEIASLSDSTKSGFAVPNSDAKTSALEKKLAFNNVNISLLDEETSIWYHEVMEKLKYSLPMKEGVTIKGRYFKNVFLGSDLIDTVMEKFLCPRDGSINLCVRFMNTGLFHPIGDSKKGTTFDSLDATSHFRLQCFMTPNILNSYHIRDLNSNTPTRDCIDNPFPYIKRINNVLHKIQSACVDEIGMLDYAQCAIHPMYPVLQDALCELQLIDLTTFSENEKLAFGINLYRIMINLAFIKIGIPVGEADQIHFLTHVKFNVGNNIFSLADWVDGVLRANAKGGIENRSKGAFEKSDQRNAYSLSTLDNRIHFALNVGSLLGADIGTPFDSYIADRINNELEVSCRVFFEDERNFNLDTEQRAITISNAVGRYRCDFGKNDSEFITVVSQYLTGSHRAVLTDMISSGPVKYHYIDTNWGRNGKNYRRYEKDLLRVDITGPKALLRRFRPPKDADNEMQRLETLKSLKVLDTSTEDRFDIITKKVQEEFGFPIVLISLVDTHRQWFKSKQWDCKLPAPSEAGRDISFCGHAILQDDVFVIEDALLDDRFADNPFVLGDFKLRCYVGAPLKVPGNDGLSHNIGTLCCIDHRPRTFSKAQEQALKKYAQEVTVEMQQQSPSDKHIQGEKVDHFFL